jgi:hypothetical protein
LVARTLAPVGPPFGKGETAALLSDLGDVVADVRRTLLYWNALFGVT